MVTNYELKLKARIALKNNWQIALMVALISSLPSLISQVVSLMNQNGMMQTLNSVMISMQGNAAITNVEEVLRKAGITLENYIPTLGLGLISAVLSPFLTLGFLNYTFKLLRGEEDALIGTVFSRTNCFFKAIGLNLMIALRVFLWMMAGFAVELVGMVMVLSNPNALGDVGFFVMYAGMIVMIVLGVRAGMHYAMATRVMAETPSLGINRCIRESVEMMSHRKLLLFSLEMSFILLHLGISLLEGLLLSMFGGVLASTASMVLSFMVNVYMQMSVSVFYMVYRKESSI